MRSVKRRLDKLERGGPAEMPARLRGLIPALLASRGEQGGPGADERRGPGAVRGAGLHGAGGGGAGVAPDGPLARGGPDDGGDTVAEAQSPGAGGGGVNAPFQQ